ncbi:MAG: PilZ domain-containing protein [Burkholderiales bacterium]|nr:PilZ domain-containing protein [Burkholderiales bacterium]
MNTSTDRRLFLRSAFHAPVRLGLGEHESPAFLHDVSLKGALVEVSSSWGGRVGEVCRLHLELAPDAAILMDTTVAHIEGRHVGLHCERLDLDSMTHLRQLVEHNADDPALLERDLATLVAQGRDAT